MNFVGEMILIFLERRLFSLVSLGGSYGEMESNIVISSLISSTSELET